MVNVLLEGFVLGLAGSFHCMVMCGPIALALPLNRKNTGTILRGIGSNQLGRILTYTLLGSVFGIIGFQLPVVKGFQIATVLTGLAFLVVIWKPQWMRKLEWQPAFLNRFRQQKMGSLLKEKKQINLFLLGILNGLLPCALIVMALGISISQGSSGKGALFMMGYGLGTVPGVSSVAFLGSRMLQQIPVKLKKAAPLAFSIVALLMIARGLNLGIPYISPKIENKEATLVKSDKMPHQVICQ